MSLRDRVVETCEVRGGLTLYRLDWPTEITRGRCARPADDPVGRYHLRRLDKAAMVQELLPGQPSRLRHWMTAHWPAVRAELIAPSACSGEPSAVAVAALPPIHAFVLSCPSPA
jgi:hypothetical protein